jgi:hypothetical protein
MNLLPSVVAKNFLSTEETEHIQQLIISLGQYEEYRDINGRNNGRLIATHHTWDYHAEATQAIRNILDSKFEALLGKRLEISLCHLVNSYIPFLLHSDYNNDLGNNYESEYNIIIPLNTYDSKTVVFNEYTANSNDFDEFKSCYTGDLSVKIDKEFCRQRLSHIHPSDLRYLTLKETFDWEQGSIHVCDRRYYHCSDNFIKRGISNKVGLVLWSQVKKV